jgi:hypothetical protein
MDDKAGFESTNQLEGAIINSSWHRLSGFNPPLRQDETVE